MAKNVPQGVIERLPTYLNCLIQLRQQGVEKVSSKRMGNMTGVNPAQIRRDLVYFGTFGIKGVGYEVGYLVDKIRKILGSDEPHQIALVGAGKLGSAIASHDALGKHGFKIAAVFDVDVAKVGGRLGNAPIHHVGDMPRILEEQGIDMAILAVPPATAQKAADQLVRANVSVILNYTSVMISVPPSVTLHHSDPVNDLLYALYYLSGRRSVRKP